jgi:putative transposase
MSRYRRIVLAGLPHHVVLRGNNRRRLFSSRADYTRFLYLIGRGLARGGCEINACTLMDNHVHMVVRPFETSALSDFVRFVGQRYAQSRNLAKCASGKLFEERFYSRPITDDRQLAVVMAYVELNPVKAGMVQHPGEHPWSTYRHHAAEVLRREPFPAGLWTPSAWYLALSADPSKRAEMYREWIVGCHNRNERPEGLPTRLVVDLESRVRDRRRFDRPDGVSVI